MSTNFGDQLRSQTNAGKADKPNSSELRKEIEYLEGLPIRIIVTEDERGNKTAVGAIGLTAICRPRNTEEEVRQLIDTMNAEVVLGIIAAYTWNLSEQINMMQKEWIAGKTEQQGKDSIKNASEVK